MGVTAVADRGEALPASEGSREAATARTRITPGFFWIVVICCLVLALLTRAGFYGTPGFPLGEGGLFVRFSELIIEGGFALPDTIDYGARILPFGYPPAGFYLAALVSKLTGASLFQVYYYLPIILNLAAVPAFCFLAAHAGKQRMIFLAASILYVQLPESFVWQITGGGMPRSLAALFCFLAVGCALKAAECVSRRLTIGAGLLVGATILSHLEWGIMATAGMTLAFVTRHGIRRSFPSLMTAGLPALLLILPWLVAVLGRHGLEPFLSSSSASQWNIGNFGLDVVTGRMFGLLLWPALFGVVASIRERDWFSLLWAFLVLILTPRMGGAAGLAVPSALLAGRGLGLACDLIFARTSARSETPQGVGEPAAFPSGAERLMLLFLLFFSLLFASPFGRIYMPPAITEQLDGGTRDAMRWISTNTDEASRFVLISEAPAWWADRTAEWFPLLAHRESLTTAQGLEWAGPGVFAAKQQEIAALKGAQGQPAGLAAFLRARFCGADHLVLFLPTESSIRSQLLHDPEFRPVFANRRAAVLRWQAGGKCDGDPTRP